MSKLTYVSSSYGDWCVVYIDERLDYEGHSIPTREWIDCINLGNLKEATSFEVDGLWLELNGAPEKLEDIPRDKIK